MHDFHTHFIPTDVIHWLKENEKAINAEWVNKDENKEDFLIINQKWGFELKKSFIDFEDYMENQSKVGVTHSMISPIPQLFLYDFPLEICTEMSRVYNQSLCSIS